MSDLRHPDDAVDRELTAHVLGELDAVESDRLQQRLRNDPELRSRLKQLSATVVVLSQLPREAWEPEEPPPPPNVDLGTPTAAPAATLPERAHRRRRLRLPGAHVMRRPLTTVAAAAALVAVGVLVGVLVKSSSGSTSARIVASARLAPIANLDPSARGVFQLASDRTARFEVSGLTRTDSHHVYELWLMDTTRDLISIATFRVNATGRAQLTLTLPAAPAHFRYLDVSLQPLDGSAAHSKISVLRGPTPI